MLEEFSNEQYLKVKMDELLFHCKEGDNFLFNTLIPFIQKLALQLPELVTKPLPYLEEGQSISLSQIQVASIMANAFFCTFPPCLKYFNFQRHVFHSFIVYCKG
jgi:hypothetical protein